MLAIEAAIWITLLAAPAQPVNMDKLARAVAAAESSGCRSNVALRTNNCHGITRKGKYTEYASTEESYADFKGIWKRGYGGYPTRAKAAKYSSEGAADRWLCHVQRVYFSIPLECI